MLIFPSNQLVYNKTTFLNTLLIIFFIMLIKRYYINLLITLVSIIILF